jgi:hypothetical protein
VEVVKVLEIQQTLQIHIQSTLLWVGLAPAVAAMLLVTRTPAKDLPLAFSPGFRYKDTPAA